MNIVVTKKDTFRDFCHAYFIGIDPDTKSYGFVGMDDNILRNYLTDGVFPFDLGNAEMDTFEKSSKVVKEMYNENALVTLDVVENGMDSDIVVTRGDGFSFVLPYSGEELYLDGKPYFKK